MEHPIDESELDRLLAQNLSQRAIAERLHTSRSTLRRHLERRKGVPEKTVGTPLSETNGTPIETQGVPLPQQHGTPQVYQQFPFADAFTESWGELQEIITWWRERKQILTRTLDETRKRRRQTYHVEERFIDAIKRAADLEHTDLAEIVNRAFECYFAERERTS